MTRKIRGTLKRFGEWDIKWNSLQLRILWYFFISVMVAFILYQLSAYVYSSWFEARNFEEWKKYKEISETTAENLVRAIEGFNSEDAVEYLKEYDPEFRASIVLVDADGILKYHKLYDFAFFDNDNHGYSMPYITLPVELDRGTGLLVYQSIPFENKLFIGGDYILIFIAVLIFAIIFLFQSRKIIKDINYMDSCVYQITSGNLDVEIRQSGSDEFGHLAENIEIMRKSLKKMLEEKEQNEQRNHRLISGISHDLKTPLTSLIGYLDILRNTEKISTTAEEQKLYMERCFNQSQRLKQLISNLFTYVKYTDSSMKLSKTVFSFRDLIEQALEEQNRGISERGIILEVNTGPEDSSVYGDPDHLARVLYNLLDNLRLYTDGNMRAELCLHNEKGGVILELSNTAEALRGRNAEELFDRMVRGDESRSRQEGSGLGLSICREIVRLHQGSIDAEITGSRFKVTLRLPDVN